MHFQVNGGLSGDPISCEPLFWEVLRDTLFRLTEEGGVVVMALLVSSDPQGRCCERWAHIRVLPPWEAEAGLTPGPLLTLLF